MGDSITARSIAWKSTIFDEEMRWSGREDLNPAHAGQKITLRSRDFWRCEEGLIRENWVLVDLLDVYTQIGVDVFRRMEEFTHDRQR